MNNIYLINTDGEDSYCVAAKGFDDVADAITDEPNITAIHHVGELMMATEGVRESWNDELPAQRGVAELERLIRVMKESRNALIMWQPSCAFEAFDAALAAYETAVKA